MSEGRETPDALFERLAEAYLRDPDVTAGTGFGSNAGLRVSGRIFAMVVRGELVVKLPAARVDTLVAAGAGHRFDTGRGRSMREWLAVQPASPDTWETLVAEACAFVRG